VALREELASVDEYLDIEVVRFGPQLTVEKDIAPETLDIPVPSMLLQPVIENSIKHGLAPKVGGGRVLIRTSLDGPNLVIEIDDNGLGMSQERLQAAMAEGIGLSNVHERLRVIYASRASVHLSSAPGRGTRVRIEVPRVHSQERLTA
jgi:two-component system LytT family sensor kinase